MTELKGEALLRIDRAIRRFEDAWQNGERPSLEALLAGKADGRARDELLHYAMAVELAYRRHLGEVPEPDEYKERFPDGVRVIETAFTEANTLDVGVSTTADRPSDKPGFADFLLGTTIDSPNREASSSVFLHGRLGKYEVLRPLGDGGQGQAFLARDPDVGRLVVVKRYHAASDDAAREAKALGRVNSPYVARCLELMRHEGEPFLVMEYIAGRSLSEVLKQDTLAPRTAARIAEQVAEGLEAVHACGLVHRDVKPSNVILGDDGVGRLVDFGLAAHLGSEAFNGISGTPPYMPPEQARGQWERIDARSDVYGVGGVLYALLTGKPPHPGTSSRESLEHARQGVVVPPRDLKLARPIPRALERVVMKALEPDSSRRFASALELRRALQRARQMPALRTALVGLVAAIVLVPAVWIIGRPKLSPKGAAQAPATKSGAESDQVGAPGMAREALAADNSPTSLSTATQAEPLSGDLSVQVWSEREDGPAKGRKIDDPDALPVINGERVQLQVRLNRPAYIYLLWVSSEGKVLPLHPWNDPRLGFASSQPRPEPEAALQCPPRLDRGWAVQGVGGLETALLLAHDTPLPPEIALDREIGRLPAAPLDSPHEIVWIDYAQGRPVARRSDPKTRNLNLEETQRLDDPILQMMERLRPHFRLLKAVRFAHQGD